MQCLRLLVSDSMQKVEVLNSYKSLTKGIESIPFIDNKSIDFEHFVTPKVLVDLFYLIGEQGKNISTDLTAPSTDLLKTVFDK